jgi:hypothetical protein
MDNSNSDQEDVDSEMDGDMDGDMENERPEYDGDIEAGLRAFRTVGQFMEEDGWHPQVLEDNYVHRAYFVGHNGEVTCFAQVRVDLEQFIFYVVMPVRAPANMRTAVAEYITRANYGLRIGNFEMDFDDGEVRYKSSIDFEGVELTPGLIRNTIYPAVQTMDRYLPGVLSVVFGGKSAEEAIAAIEENE